MSQAIARLVSQSKPTYKFLSNAIVATALQLIEHGKTTPGEAALRDLVNDLHRAPRLTQWIETDDPVVTGYRIFADDDSVSVTVQENRIYMTKGIRVFELQEGLPAATLFKAIETAQTLVAPAVTTPAMSEEEQAEFFKGEGNGADIDAALAESEDSQVGFNPHPKQTEAQEEDAELIEEVLNEDQTKVEGEPIITVSQAFIEDLTETKEKSKAFKREVGEMAALGRGMGSRLKSLQGRILTIVDASPIADKTQRDAVKSLINKEFRRELSHAMPTVSLVDQD